MALFAAIILVGLVLIGLFWLLFVAADKLEDREYKTKSRRAKK